MARVQTNWHLDALTLPDDSDPMAEIAELKSGDLFDLSKSEADLNADLQETLDREGRYFNRGVHCRLKWDPGHVIGGGTKHSCFACEHHRPPGTGSQSGVCRIGREQETIVAQLASLQGAPTLDQDFLAAAERDIDAGAELAEAVL